MGKEKTPIQELLEAVQIFAKYDDGQYPINAAHDEIRFYVDPEKVTEADVITLSELGFDVDDEYDCFHSFKYGSFDEIPNARDKALDQIMHLITEQTRKAVEDQYNKSVEVLKDVMAENFHYRLMCGEIKDPSGKIDVHKAFIDYQELEPERQKFAEYLESRLALNPHHKAEE